MGVNCEIRDNDDWDLVLDVGVMGDTVYLRIEESDGNNFTGTRRKVLGQIAIPLADLIDSIAVAKVSDSR